MSSTKIGIPPGRPALVTPVLWKGSAVLSLVAGLCQNWLIADRASHALTRCWKTGLEPGLIGAGGQSLIAFILGTALFVALAMVSVDRLARIRDSFRHAAQLGAVLLWTGGLVWLGMIVSPAVALHW